MRMLIVNPIAGCGYACLLSHLTLPTKLEV